MARSQAQRRRRKAAKLAHAAPVCQPANDDTRAPDLVDALMALFPPAAVAASRARHPEYSGAATELQRTATHLRRRAAARPATDGPTDAQLAKGTYAAVKTKDPDHAAPIERPRNAAAPFDRWRARGQLTPRQFDACDRYRLDYAAGGFERRVTMNWAGGGGGGDGTAPLTGYLAATHAQLDARRRRKEARAAMPKRFRGYYDAVVLYEASPDAIGGEIGATGNARAAFAAFVIRTCADILGDWYRLPE